jgi:hypothetical protein
VRKFQVATPLIASKIAIEATSDKIRRNDQGRPFPKATVRLVLVMSEETGAQPDPLFIGATRGKVRVD